MEFFDPNNPRQFPRKDFNVPIGILNRGQYFLAEVIDISEGGVSVNTDYALPDDAKMVLTFQMPDGKLYSVKAQVRHIKKKGALMTLGIAFLEVSMVLRRQIRIYVSDMESSKKNPFQPAFK